MSTYKINSNKKTKNSPTIVDHQSNGVEIANFATPTLSKRPIVEGLPALNTVLTKNEVDKRQPFKSGNRFMSTQEYLGNNSIFNGTYVPYLRISFGEEGSTVNNWYFQTGDSNIFYTSDVDKLLPREYIKTDFIRIANENSISFTIGKIPKQRNAKIHVAITPSMVVGTAFSSYTQEEYNDLEEFFLETFDNLSAISQQSSNINDYTVMSGQNQIMRYVAATPDDCGYCAVLKKQPQGLSVELQGGVSFPSGDGPVNNEQGFPLVASSCAELEQEIANTLASYSGTSMELGYPIVWSFTYADGNSVAGEGCNNLPDDVALAYSYICPNSVPFPENIIHTIEIVGDTYDNEGECNAYKNNPGTSGCYAWIPPGAGFGIASVNNIPNGYAYCSDEFEIY